ncbi:hypothetical protein LO80_08850 [Candidatus Francisella endociliophora]|uniref:Permuted papain-like amidase YaeF/Yiix C92 family enzyme n=1 Tax=Candidatus Francisella endociliophora TaxID=653937 RepID=A0A097ER66_9GAMM|nr:YiiX/YebB-like N1pC/P60 family cysteine hydrolase [Francisella sp. FSC1006]AIT10065.1 hypothetical protein LO80_08850 [Francisella sp. FSC1006]
MLRKGDIIFIVDNTEKNISELSVGYGGYSYYHCALYIGDGEVIEAVSSHGVIQNSLSKYVNYKMLTGRVDETKDFLDRVVLQAKEFLGYGYNDLFLPFTKNKLYCSELIHEAFNQVSDGEYFAQHKLNYIAPNDLEVSQYWIDFYGKHGLKVPQGKSGSHPNNLSLDEKFIKKVFIS